MALRAIGSVAALGDTQSSGFSGTTLVQNDTDEVAGIAGVLGYAFPDVPLRVEVEAAHRFRFDWDVNDVAAPIVDYEMNVATTSILLSAVLEWRNGSDFTTFFGPTIGWTRNYVETGRGNLGAAKVTHDNTTNNFAWGGTIGVDWHFAENMAAEFAYRYINLGDVDTGPAATGEIITADDYVSHDVLISILYRF